MPIKLDCPRCKHSLWVPSKKAGSYVVCPRCSGRFWIPDAPPAGPAAPPTTGATGAAASAGLTGSGHFPTASPPSTTATRGPAVAAPPSAPPASAKALAAPANLVTPPTPPSAAPPVAAPRRRVAKFIAAEAAQSGLKLAEDGKLPVLRLKEAGHSDAKQAGAGGVNPIVLFGALAFGLMATLALVFMPTESESPRTASEKQAARLEIQDNYIASMEKGATLEPYQVLLREALQAQSRHDDKEERRFYRKVLDMLRAERGKFDRGLTGSPTRDDKLEKLITTLLSD